MDFTPEERERVENFILFLIAKKTSKSGGHNGLVIHDISKVLEEMAEGGKIIMRPNPTKKSYFLNDSK